MHLDDERLRLGAARDRVRREELRAERLRVDDGREVARVREVREARERRAVRGRVGRRRGERLARLFGGGEVRVRAVQERGAVDGRGEQRRGRRVGEARRVVRVVQEEVVRLLSTYISRQASGARRGATHDMRVDRVVDLVDPVPEVFLLVFHRRRVLRILDRPEHSQHARRRPAVACRPEPVVLDACPHHDVLPQHVRRLARAAQVRAVQLDLCVRLLDHRLVLRDHAVVRQEGGDHVDEVRPAGRVLAHLKGFA